MEHQPVAIIVVFKYPNKDNELPGVTNDLELVVGYLTKVGFKIYTITDFNHDSIPIIRYTNIENFIAVIYNILSQHIHKHYVIYYSGHTKNSCLILPDDQKICMSSFRKLIVSNIANIPSVQVVLIMDCCNSNGFDLPYELTEDGKYRLVTDTSVNEPIPPIICISSSRINEGSVVGSIGSIFTRSLFISMYDKGYKYLPLLINQVKKECSKYYNQTPNILTSCYRLVMWNWMYGITKYDIDRDLDGNWVVTQYVDI
jgi:hypothetical protein